MNALTVDRLSHTFAGRVPVHALEDLSCAAADGLITALIGPNGSGKSTLFRLMTGILPVQRGRLEFFGRLHAGDMRLRGMLGVVFQSPSLDPHLTVKENLYHHALLYGIRLNREPLSGMLPVDLGITDLFDRKISTLSGGFQRRVELAKVLISRPRMIVLDEPFAGLDVHARETFFNILRHLSHTSALPVFLTTHDLDLAGQCDSVIILDRGRLVLQDRPARLLAEYGPTVVEMETTDVPAVAARLSLQRHAKTYPLGDTRLLVSGMSAAEVFGTLGDLAPAVHRVDVRPPGLQDYFQAKTGSIMGELPVSGRAA